MITLVSKKFKMFTRTFKMMFKSAPLLCLDASFHNLSGTLSNTGLM